MILHRRYYDVNQITVHYASGKTARLSDDIYEVEILDGVIEIMGKSKPEVVNFISLSAVTSISIRRTLDDFEEEEE